jgi:VWFA-related protein
MQFRSMASAALTIAVAGALLLVPARRAAGRSTADAREQDAQQGTIRVGVGLVNLYATVRDKHKGIVANLEQKNFHVYEDNVEQKIAFFSREKTLPITLGMLIDTSGSEQFMLDAEKAAAVQFLSEVVKQKDEAMVISFDLDADLLSDWTSDMGELTRAIRRAQINTGGGGGPVTPGPLPTSGNKGTIFYDAVYAACHDKLSSEAGRKALVVLTDAEDNGSQVKLQDAIEAAQRADAVVHVLLIADRSAGFSFGGGGNTSVASKLAGETGGRMIDVSNEKRMREAFDQISEELRSEYVLGYYPTNDKHDGSFRKVRVEVDDKDNKVLSRKGYYAPAN